MDDFAAAQYSYTLSTNPPNPRSPSNAFRQGDWLCPRPFCSVHNFSRNIACISCGGPRPPLPVTSPATPSYASPMPWASPQSALQMQSPRFAATTPTLSMQTKSPNGQSLLTPSGRSFSVGGKVQNVSSDPLAPCIIFWPDNEPFPEQGQIRPPMASSVQPPILNTGNKGPIEHQPGDWICQRCEYHNWRRRKVCQTCFPFAEGNSDNVTTAAQQDRINLLASLLAQQHAAAAAVQFTSPFSPTATNASATPVQQPLPPPPPPPYQLPIALPDASPKPYSGLGFGAQPGSGIPTPPNEVLDLSGGHHMGAFGDLGHGRPSASQASRLTRFASQPSLRAQVQVQAGGGSAWPPSNNSPFASSSNSSSPHRAPLSASYLQTAHQLPHLGHRPPPLNTMVSPGMNLGSWSAGPTSAKSDTFSFASSSSDFELPPLPSAPSPYARRFGSVAAVPSSLGRDRDHDCAPRHTASLDLDALRMLKFEQEEGIEDVEEEDSELSLSRPGTGTTSTRSSLDSRSSSSQQQLPPPVPRAMGSMPEVQSIWTQPRQPQRASVAALSMWTAGDVSERSRARPDLQLAPLAPIGSGRQTGSSPTSATGFTGYIGK
ncbi:hypothetical protein EXIGLDRAFT_126858 [Exidia glandulosa HHB12029]|uniref:RanBP2-type domain-containing protein n=1 Tax=Exidia glandulosa HHB12029 TaxID=1314781 RepID=A0A165G9V2_EXIGL|nr:hypothetical protein EXIGLDRAFT_126858 [Exidia glandulosa HHB12029]